MKKHKKFGGDIFKKCLPLSIISPSCVMMRRTLFEEIGLFDEMLLACEDYDLWLRVSAQFPIGLIEKPYTIRYGGHEDQQSKKFPAMDRFRVEAIKKILASNTLTDENRVLAIQELKNKCAILVNGARKRGKSDEASRYNRMFEEVTEDKQYVL